MLRWPWCEGANTCRAAGSAGLMALALAALPGAAAAQAGCSRELVVPVAPIGLSVTVTGEEVAGVYPEVLRSSLAREGCPLKFSVVPRARQELMFETGRADLLVPATRTPKRDESGVFVPMVSSRAMVISMMHAERAPLRNLADLQARREIRVVLVRGFDYGESYQALIKELDQQGRLLLAVDAVSVARMLGNGMAEATVMAPSILVGAMLGDARVRPLLEQLRYEPMDELPWGESGVYVSKTALSEADRQSLLALLERAAKSGQIWREFVKHYPPGSLTGSVRPR